MKIQSNHVVIGILGIILIMIVFNRAAPKAFIHGNPMCDKSGHHVTADEEEAYRYLQLRSSQRQMLPVTNPFLNARLIAIEMNLLQDHLEIPGMLCTECIARKHIPKIEGYANEAIGLVDMTHANDPAYQALIQDMRDLSVNMRELQMYFIENPEGHALHCGRMVRRMRKYLSQRYGIMNELAYQSY